MAVVRGSEARRMIQERERRRRILAALPPSVRKARLNGIAFARRCRRVLATPAQLAAVEKEKLAEIRESREEGGRGKIVGEVPLCCRSLDAYEIQCMIGEGSYGVVAKAKNRQTGEIVAVKKVDLNSSAVREISIMICLRSLPGIVGLKEVVTAGGGPDKHDSIFLVMEYAKDDLDSLRKKMRRPFTEAEVKVLMRQLFRGIYLIHDRGILHRDLKMSNILLNCYGRVKICDFGLSQPCPGGDAWVEQPYADRAGSLWYMAPELLLEAEAYSAAVDMWSAACVMANLVAGAPLFAGRDVIDQLHRIFCVLGRPDEETWPSFPGLCSVLPFPLLETTTLPYVDLRERLSPSLSGDGIDLLMGLLQFDPRKRMTAGDALEHKWFR